MNKYIETENLVYTYIEDDDRETHALSGVSLTVQKLKNNRFKLIFTADGTAPQCSVNAQVKVKYTFKYYESRRKEWRTSVNTFYLPMLRITVR